MMVPDGTSKLALTIGLLVIVGTLAYALAAFAWGPPGYDGEGNEVRERWDRDALHTFGFPLWAALFTTALWHRRRWLALAPLAIYLGHGALFGLGLGGRPLIFGGPLLLLACLLAWRHR